MFEKANQFLLGPWHLMQYLHKLNHKIIVQRDKKIDLKFLLQSSFHSFQNGHRNNNESISDHSLFPNKVVVSFSISLAGNLRQLNCDKFSAFCPPQINQKIYSKSPSRIINMCLNFKKHPFLISTLFHLVSP